MDQEPCIAEHDEEIKLEMEAKHDERIWRSCCLRMDRGIVILLSQMSIGMATLTVCAIQLIRSDFNCVAATPYFNILSIVVGFFLGNFKD
jgi:hypothetical protein